jgi:hypothetical protein
MGYELLPTRLVKAHFETRTGLSGHIVGTIPVKVDFLGCKITPTVHSLPRFAFRAAIRRKSWLYSATAKGAASSGYM